MPPFEVVAAAAVGVVGRPVLLDVVVGHRGGRPVVAVGAHLGVGVEVVEEHEPLGELMMVGRDVPAEEHERGIPVPCRQVAQDLVVGPVLLDDVDHVLDERRVPDPPGDRVGRRVPSPLDEAAAGFVEPVVPDDAGRRLRESGPVGSPDHRDRSRDHAGDVLGLRGAPRDGARPVGVGTRAQSLRVGDQQRSPVARDGHGRRVPRGGDQPGDPGRQRRGRGTLKVDNRDIVVPRVGDEEPEPIRAYGEAVRDAPLGGPRVRSQRDRADDAIADRVDNRDAVVVGIRHIEAGPDRVDGQRARMQTDGDGRERGEAGARCDPQDRERAVAPVADVRFLAGRGNGDRVRQRAGRGRGPGPPGGEVDRPHLVREVLGDEQRAAVRSDREAGRVGAGVGRRQRDRRPLREPPPAHLVGPEQVVAARGSVEAASVRAPGDADVQRLGRPVRDRLDHRPPRNVHERERLRALPVVADGEITAVGAQRRAERPVAHRDLRARWRERPVVGGDTLGPVRARNPVRRGSASRCGGGADARRRASRRDYADRARRR